MVSLEPLQRHIGEVTNIE